MDVLRLGAYQLLFMRIPSHAAVSESVDLARKVAGPGSAKFVNAVLRKISTKSWDEWRDEVTADLQPADKLAVTYSYPAWVIRALADAYGVDAQGVIPILEAGNEPADVTLIARPAQSDVDELLAETHGHKGKYSPYAVVMNREANVSRRPGDLDDVKTGRVGVQDEGSQVVALVVASVPVEGSEERWLDMCAGPGGKAAILAGLASQRDIDFTALEPVPARSRLVENSLRHAPGHYEVITTDAREFESADKFDRILIDAPCTGLGALRRRPESRWRKQPGDVPALAALQKELLEHASGLVRVGGVIGYATCSPHLSETKAIVDGFLRKHNDFELVEIGGVIPELGFDASATALRLRPDVHGTDGMYLAVLKKRP
jgi:16S rRNA (cytosine967-C5)-methyltransferase